MPILRHMHMRTLLTALVLTAVVGCGGVSSDAVCEPGSSDPCNDQGQGEGLTFPSALQGVTWQLVTVERAPGEENVQDLASSLAFGSTVVSGKACNYFGAKVADATSDRIATDGFDSTAMGCEGPAGDLDRLVQEVLASGATWQRQDETLTLARGDVTLTFAPQPA